MKNFFTKNWQHLAVFAVFVIIMITYFSPQFDGNHIKQHDVQQFKGMANETYQFRERTGDEPLWTNSMFGGMPTTQITVNYPGNFFQKSLLWLQLTLGFPTAIFLLHLIGFYLLALLLRIRPLVGFVGALAFALATYEIVILQAGHNSKAMTVALMAPVVGAFIYAYRSNWKWGVLLSALFMTYQIASNHLQVTYYLTFLLLALGLYELIRSIKLGELKPFVRTTAALIAVYLLAAFINYGNVSLTSEYAKHTIRGGNDLSITPQGEALSENTKGLDKEYITNWSYGVGESFTLISPYVKGSASAALSNTNFADAVANSDRSPKDIKTLMDAPFPVYWGDQPMTSGPVYLGVVMLYLFFLGMFFVKSRIKWVLLGVSVLALMLSWGKNFMGLTDFFIDYVPGYNKFRTVTIILVILELCVPILAILFLEQLHRDRDSLKASAKKFLSLSGLFIFFLIALRFVGLGDNYTSKDEIARMDELPAQIEQQIMGMDPQYFIDNYKIDVRNPEQLKQLVDAQVEGSYEQYDLMKGVRKDIFESSMNRSILFALLISGLLALMFYTSVSSFALTIGISVLVLMDFIPVDQNYLSSELVNDRFYKYWIPKAEALYPHLPELPDSQIMEQETALDAQVKQAVLEGEKRGQQKAEELGYTGTEKRRLIESYRFQALNFATNYRVFDYNGGWSSSRASYFHKSLGGYHGAKLRSIQNLFEFHLSNSNNTVLNMMNVKYLIQKDKLSPNPGAMGNAWFVKRVEVVKSPDDEIRALGTSIKLTNTGEGNLLINGLPAKEALVYGQEKIQYLLADRDTMKVPMSNGLRKGLDAAFVMDTNGATNLVPVLTLELDTLNSFKELLRYNVVEEFTPSEEAIMNSEIASTLTKKDFTAEGTIRMLSYAPNKIVYKADCKGSQLAVFSEIYYPDGWKALVNGKEATIMKVNYLLRGLQLESGKNRIEFVYNLPKYHRSNAFALAGSVVLLLLFGVGFYTDRKKLKKD